ncbi:MAG TPA: citramalate synthase [Thermodesulfovibrio thiophilus]|uniref:citramalate synthase n=1 Tax=Thermodesulfovibrio thiophilus TaxID=340095 RepID=UPI00041A21EE|nr:citramalate synthase [Thermodesulfovibrio thiophilus]HQA03223.1 citramalate synthase [Thermodesulfovibrio thiophilus]
MNNLEIYDTTLRDGSQAEDISFSVDDKLKITEKLDELGIHYIEGGWPGSNPKDAEYFKKVKKLQLNNAVIVAFGSTHRPKIKVENDPNVKSLIASETKIFTIFGKTWDFHVTEALKVSLEENLELIFNTITFLKKYSEKVFFDAEHFFDGYKNNPEYALRCLKSAEDAKADCIILCDTNGGTLPNDVEKIIREVKSSLNVSIGIHAHNDSDCAVANSIVAVLNGAAHVQGTVNGFGERCGNANLCSVLPNLQFKLGYKCIDGENLKKLTEVSRFVYEIANLNPFKRQPFVGESAFAHKGGVHVSAVSKRPETYEHIKPELVGNRQRILVSDLAGKSNILKKAEELGIPLQLISPEVQAIVNAVKTLENEGYQFESAEASLELLFRKTLGLKRKFFDLIGFRVIDEKRSNNYFTPSEATIMVKVGRRIEHTAATGNGPVNALDNALRKALEKFYPELKKVKLKDYKVRVVNSGKGTASKVRVLIESGDEKSVWSTVGVSENIIEASWQAIVDSIEYKLCREKLKKGEI